MAISLYECSVLSYVQTLTGVAAFMNKGLAHFREQDIDPEEIVETRIFPDMLPFRFQIHQIVFHSAGAVEAIKSGALHLPGERPAHDYAGLQALVAEAQDELETVTPAEINSREGTEIVFKVRDNTRLFTAEGYVQSFSLPNLHFHATTAYNIMRAKGVPLGKRDFMGPLRLKK
jgi:uncharacterized protein